MEKSGVLPVGVMVPVLNARGELPRHLKAMQRWLDRVEEVVVVDSHSTDGTLEFLKQRLVHPKVRFLSHPPGLYPSWNCGIAELEAKYFTVSTLGDTVTAEGLERLVETAEKLGADVVVSPPTLVDGEGRAVEKEWPIHRHVKGRRVGGPVRIEGWEWLAWGLVDLPGTLIGSSASNLYRTEFMQARPFSSDYGRMGDSAWALANAFEARFAVDPRVESTFWIHAPPPGIEQQYGRVARPFAELAERMVRLGGEVPSGLRRVVEGFAELREDFVRYFEAGAQYRELKNAGGWRGRWQALGIRRERRRIRKRLQAFREMARDVLAAGNGAA